MSQKMGFGRAPLLLGAVLLLMAGLWFTRPMNTAVSPEYAIQKPPAATVLKALPELAEKPLMLEFRTTLCADCQALAPVLEKVAKQYPQVGLLVYNLDKDRKARPAVFELFQPVTVPTLVGLDQTGQIRVTLGEKPTKTDLKAAFESLKSTR